MSRLTIENIHEGDRLPALEKPAFTTRQLVEYAGASGDFNRIHYDEPFARAAGFPSVIAHGMLSMAYFGELLSSWAGGPAAIVRLGTRFKAVALIDDVVTCTGEVVEKKGNTIQVRLTATKQTGEVLLEGTATLRL